MAMDRRWCSRVLLLLAFAPACLCLTLDEIMSVHPDGTPVHAAEMKSMLAKNAAEEQPLDVLRNQEVYDAVMGDSLETFTDVMQRHNYRHIFHEDGSARDIARWRQNVRDDTYYSELLRGEAPEVHKFFTDPTVPDSKVQDQLRRNVEKSEL